MAQGRHNTNCDINLYACHPDGEQLCNHPDVTLGFSYDGRRNQSIPLA
jgi:hypothetical protein